MAENSNPLPTKKHSSPRPSFEVETPMRKKDSQSLSSSASRLSSSRNSQSRSQNVRQFLFALNELESLYICPITLLLPLEIRQQVPHCVQRYEIKDYQGVTRFYAVETTPTCSYTFCSDARPFDIKMFDLSGSLILECYRNCSGTLCICGVDCCAGGVNTGVNFGSRTSYIGSIGTRSTCRSPSYMVREEISDERFIIRGPKHGKLLPCKLCGIHTFTICARNTNASVGKIMYGYDGLSEELVPNPQTVGVIFPPRCSSEMKTCLLAAGFMLEVTYFNKRGVTCHRITRHSICILMMVGILVVCFTFPFLSDIKKEIST